MTGFDPRDLRRALGCYMTGVTVVTTCAPSGNSAGFTANSFASVSLDPPVLLVCSGKFHSGHDTFAAYQHFAVNVLSEGQEDIFNTLTSFKGDRFAGVAHRIDRWGSPLIVGALAQFSCTSIEIVDAGDHSIPIGRVDQFDHADGRGPGFADLQYFSLGLACVALSPPKRYHDLRRDHRSGRQGPAGANDGRIPSVPAFIAGKEALARSPCACAAPARVGAKAECGLLCLRARWRPSGLFVGRRAFGGKHACSRQCRSHGG